MERNRSKSKIPSLRHGKVLKKGKQKDERFKATKKVLKRCHIRKSLPLEVLRLTTTDGFWSPPETGRSSRLTSSTPTLDQTDSNQGRQNIKPLTPKAAETSKSSSVERKTPKGARENSCEKPSSSHTKSPTFERKTPKGAKESGEETSSGKRDTKSQSVALKKVPKSVGDNSSGMPAACSRKSRSSQVERRTPISAKKGKPETRSPSTPKHDSKLATSEKRVITRTKDVASETSSADRITATLKRLTTTEGFWSPSIADVSPAAGALSLSRTGSKEREKDSNAPQRAYTSELKRLKTTDGFWSPNQTLQSSRNSSRDTSPSSTNSSMDRIASRKSAGKQNEQRNDEVSKVSEKVPGANVSVKRTRMITPVAEKEKGRDLTTPEAKISSDKKHSSCQQHANIPKRMKMGEKKFKHNTLKKKSSDGKGKFGPGTKGNNALKQKNKSRTESPSANVRKPTSKTSSSSTAKDSGGAAVVDFLQIPELRRLNTTDGFWSDLPSLSTPSTAKDSGAVVGNFLQIPELKRLNTTDGFWSPLPNISRELSGRPNRLVCSKSTQPHSRLLEHRKRKLRSLKITTRNLARPGGPAPKIAKKKSIVTKKQLAVAKKEPVVAQKEPAVVKKETIASKKVAVITKKETIGSKKEAIAFKKETIGSNSKKVAIVAKKEPVFVKQTLLEQSPSAATPVASPLKVAPEKVKRKHFMFGVKKFRRKKKPKQVTKKVEASPAPLVSQNVSDASGELPVGSETLFKPQETGSQFSQQPKAPKAFGQGRRGRPHKRKDSKVIRIMARRIRGGILRENICDASGEVLVSSETLFKPQETGSQLSQQPKAPKAFGQGRRGRPQKRKDSKVISLMAKRIREGISMEMPMDCEGGSSQYELESLCQGVEVFQTRKRSLEELKKAMPLRRSVLASPAKEKSKTKAAGNFGNGEFAFQGKDVQGKGLKVELVKSSEPVPPSAVVDNLKSKASVNSENEESTCQGSDEHRNSLQAEFIKSSKPVPPSDENRSNIFEIMMSAESHTPDRSEIVPDVSLPPRAGSVEKKVNTDIVPVALPQLEAVTHTSSTHISSSIDDEEDVEKPEKAELCLITQADHDGGLAQDLIGEEKSEDQLIKELSSVDSAKDIITVKESQEDDLKIEKECVDVKNTESSKTEICDTAEIISPDSNGAVTTSDVVVTDICQEEEQDSTKDTKEGESNEEPLKNDEGNDRTEIREAKEEKEDTVQLASDDSKPDETTLTCDKDDAGISYVSGSGNDVEDKVVEDFPLPECVNDSLPQDTLTEEIGGVSNPDLESVDIGQQENSQPGHQDCITSNSDPPCETVEQLNSPFMDSSSANGHVQIEEGSKSEDVVSACLSDAPPTDDATVTNQTITESSPASMEGEAAVASGCEEKESLDCVGTNDSELPPQPLVEEVSEKVAGVGFGEEVLSVPTEAKVPPATISTSAFDESDITSTAIVEALDHQMSSSCEGEDVDGEIETVPLKEGGDDGVLEGPNALVCEISQTVNDRQSENPILPFQEQLEPSQDQAKEPIPPGPSASAPSGEPRNLSNAQLSLKNLTKLARKRRSSCWKRGIVRKAKNVTSLKYKQSKVSAQSIDLKSQSAINEGGSLEVLTDGGSTQAKKAPRQDSKEFAGLAIDVGEPQSEKEKKLLAVLRRLKTNANLANAPIADRSFQTRARKSVLSTRSGLVKPERAKKLSRSERMASMKAKPILASSGSLPESQAAGEKVTKHEERTLPKLSPLELVAPGRRSSTDFTDSAPPVLTPQQSFEIAGSFGGETGPNVFDEVVNESVDDTDFHLYLSGASDEDNSETQSPVKVMSGSSKTNQGKSSKAPTLPHLAPSTDLPPSDVRLPMGNKPSTPRNIKMKGKKGRPPGIKVSQKEIVNRPAKTARKPASPALAPTEPQRFEFRKKTTRSPLEMLEMKRRQEEAIYDLEMERLEARKINRREKRIARDCAEDIVEDLAQFYEIKSCSVVLTDFVKKLNLNPPGPSDLYDKEPYSPSGVEYEDDLEDEDWCADLEDVDDEERLEATETVARPHIPRLKLKRVSKKGKPPSVVRNLVSEMKCPEQEPLKLVIKTEVVSDPEDSLKRLSAEPQGTDADPKGTDSSKRLSAEPQGTDAEPKGTDSSKRLSAEPQGTDFTKRLSTEPKGSSIFENNYVQFLKQRSSYKAPQPSVKYATPSSSLATRAPKVSDNSQGSSDGGLALTHVQKTGLTSDAEISSVASLPMSLDRPETSVTETPDLTSDASEPIHSHVETELARTSMLEVAAEEEEDMLILDLSGNEPSQDESSSAEGGQDLSNQTEERPISMDPSADNSLRLKELGGIAVPDDSQSASVIATIDGGETVVNGSEVMVGDATISQIYSQTTYEEDKVVSNKEKDSHAEGVAMISENQQVVEVASKSLDIVVSGVDSHVIPVLSHTQTDCAKNNLEDVTDSEQSPVISGQTDASPQATDTCLNSDLSKDNNNSKQDEPTLTVTEISNNNNEHVKELTEATHAVSPMHSTCLEQQEEDDDLSIDAGRKLRSIPPSHRQMSGSYKCKRCDYTALSRLSIESHVYSHIPGVLFQCLVCQSELSSMMGVANHYRNAHPTATETQFYISQPVEEKNFYTVCPEEKEDDDGVQPGEKTVTAQINAPAGVEAGQSPPFIISLVVSGGGARPALRASSTCHRRFVCTHCGFSTNVKEDVEHHVSDLHALRPLFTCLLCKNSVGHSESEIKEHSALVHPSRQRPYAKLPDFYDADQLAKVEAGGGGGVSPEVLRVSAHFPGEDSGQEETSVGHQLKAKEYLHLQEDLKVRKSAVSAEADSTTATDYAEESSAYVASKHEEEEVTVEEKRLSISSKGEVNSEARSSLALETKEPLDSMPPVSHPEDSDASQIKIAEVVSLSSYAQEFHSEATTTSAIVPSPQTSEDVSVSANPDATPAYLVEPEQAPQDLTKTGPSLQPLSARKEASSPSSSSPSTLAAVAETESPSTDSEPLSAVCKTTETTASKSSPALTSPASLPSSELETTTTVVSELDTTALVGATTTTVSAAAEAVCETAQVSPKETVVSSKTVESDSKAIASDPPSSSSSSSSSSSQPEKPSTSKPRPSPLGMGGLPISYQCKACKVHTPYLLMMVRHLKARHPNILCFSCPYCKGSTSFATQKQLRNHVRATHPDKVDKNEMALSEEAKRFVDAMVLPRTAQYALVGNRLILEEDIHTCTVCSLRMTSLSNVYDHLNERHSDLFEFVCPACQHFKNKSLQAVSDHCLSAHQSELDKDKVHVSVPKYLFSILTCISKQGKYTEKGVPTSSEVSLAPKENNAASSSLGNKSRDAGNLPEAQKTNESGLTSPGRSHAKQGKEKQAAHSVPVGLTAPTPSANAPAAPPPAHRTPPSVTPTAQTAARLDLILQKAALMGIPLSASAKNANAVGNPRSVVAISSSLFDTSSLSLPQQSSGGDVVAPSESPSSANPSQEAVSQERAPKAANMLPVLNIPTIRPRCSVAVAKPQSQRQPRANLGQELAQMQSSQAVPSPTAAQDSSKQRASQSSSSHSPLPPPAASAKKSTPTPMDVDWPEAEPNPDAFKIFNLRPSAMPSTPSSSSSSTSSLPQAQTQQQQGQGGGLAAPPTVFPPVSTSSFIPGPMAGFPAAMVIPQSLLHSAFPFTAGTNVANPIRLVQEAVKAAQGGRFPVLPAAAMMAVNQMPAAHLQSLTKVNPYRPVFHQEQQQQQAQGILLQQQQAARAMLGNQQQASPLMLGHNLRYNLPHALQQHQQQKQQQQQHQQQQQQPLRDMEQRRRVTPPSAGVSVSPNLNPAQASHLPTSSTVSSSLSSSSSSQLAHQSQAMNFSNASKKGRKMSSLYKCPYCVNSQPLKALDVASHIRHAHPGRPVSFQKVT